MITFPLATAGELRGPEKPEAGPLAPSDSYLSCQSSLPSPALALVGKGEARDYVFPGRLGQICGFSKWKTALDEASGVSDWVFHDIRRSVASNMQELGIRNEVVQSVLNHAVPGVGGVYLRAELEREKAEALAAWATALTRIVRPALVVA